MDGESDEALMLRIARGDERAFRALAPRYALRAASLARRICGNAADAEDIVQETFLRGFKAFDRFLDLHPEFSERITFVAMLQPTRQDVNEYVEYKEHIETLVSHINTKHGNTDWMPISLQFESNLARACAIYKQYDVIMVNAVFDGMNLVAKEAPSVNERDGVVILSENTGAHEEIGSFCLTVNPFDIEAQANALFEALTMDEDERHSRAQHIRTVVNENDVSKWLDAQREDIDRKVPETGDAPSG